MRAAIVLAAIDCRHLFTPNATDVVFKANVLMYLRHQEPLWDAELCSSPCSGWCPIGRRHDWQPLLDAVCGEA